MGAGSAGDEGAPAPPGWYETELGQRYWDGGQWTSASLPPPANYGGPAQAPHPSGISSDDRSMAMLAHLLGLVASFLAPLVIFFTKGKESAFVRHHAAEALNLYLTIVVVALGSVILLFGALALQLPRLGVVIFAVYFLVLAVSSVAALALPIMAGLAANRGEWYRIPIIFRLIK